MILPKQPLLRVHIGRFTSRYMKENGVKTFNVLYKTAILALAVRDIPSVCFLIRSRPAAKCSQNSWTFSDSANRPLIPIIAIGSFQVTQLLILLYRPDPFVRGGTSFDTAQKR